MRKISAKPQLVAIVFSIAARCVLVSSLTTSTKCFTFLPPIGFQHRHHKHHRRSLFTTKKSSSSLSAVHVWVEEAEDGFVDEDENLMLGEVCLRAVKAFAGNLHGEVNEKNESVDGTVVTTARTTQDKRLLCAGALVQRPLSPTWTGSAISSNADVDFNVDVLPVCDVWMADGYMDETNLQFQGALLVLDDLLYHHLEKNIINDRHQDYPIITDSNKEIVSSSSIVNHSMEEILSTFIVQCGGEESEYHFASHRAAKARGFKSLKEFPTSNIGQESRIFGEQGADSQTTMSLSSSSYCWKYLKQEEEDLDALVLDINDYLDNPSSPENVVQLLEQMKRIEQNESVFQ